ncbi:hypothetical protein FOA52_012582 [Chlamydomonas sp. UWO 241]|nr:hypothetical protein FOA52_012582 [Chlamydomonas sp. UWO 241]
MADGGSGVADGRAEGRVLPDPPPEQQQRRQQQQEQQGAAALELLALGPAGSSAAGGDGGGDGDGARAAKKVGVDWQAVCSASAARGETECPICIAPLARTGKRTRGGGHVATTSCSHVFHLDCVMAFEAFELAHGSAPSCPVCRSAYQRRCFDA